MKKAFLLLCSADVFCLQTVRCCPSATSASTGFVAPSEPMGEAPPLPVEEVPAEDYFPLGQDTVHVGATMALVSEK